MPFLLLTGLAFALAGCGLFQRAQRPAWRGQAENVCLSQKLVRATAYTQPLSAIDGPGICGMEHPFRVTALAEGTVALNTNLTIGCPLTAMLDQWVTQVIQPVAMARFGVPVVQLDSMGAFSCRPIDNIRGAKLSEHSFGNAVDIGGFIFADGRKLTVVKGWKGGDEQERAFLREVHAGACNFFTTVLGPGSDSFHYNHIHVDLALHGNTSTGPRRYCRPTPAPQLVPAPQRRDTLPDPPPLDEELDVAQAGSARSAMALHGLDAATPRAPLSMPSVSQLRRLPATQPRPLQSRRPPATIRPDGVFVPEGNPADWDVTGSIPGD